jgi:hypothetical protein
MKSLPGSAFVFLVPFRMRASRRCSGEVTSVGPSYRSGKGIIVSPGSEAVSRLRLHFKCAFLRAVGSGDDLAVTLLGRLARRCLFGLMDRFSQLPSSFEMVLGKVKDLSKWRMMRPLDLTFNPTHER